MKLAAVLLLLALSAAPASMAQGLSTPEALVARFIELNNAGQFASEETTALYTPETMFRDKVEQTRVEGGDLLAPDHIALGADYGIARVPVRSDNGHTADYYINLMPTPQGWRIQSVRQQSRSYSDGPIPTSLATTVEAANNINRLTFGALDKDLISFFNAQRPAFERLAAFLPSFEAAGGPSITMRDIDRRMEALRLPLGYPNISRYDGNVLVMWGGFTGGGGGFIKTTATTPPTLAVERMQIEQGEIVWIEPLSDGWYYIRTSYLDRILRGRFRTPILRLTSPPAR